jgi:hypothetical protein
VTKRTSTECFQISTSNDDVLWWFIAIRASLDEGSPDKKVFVAEEIDRLEALSTVSADRS